MRHPLPTVLLPLLGLGVAGCLDGPAEREPAVASARPPAPPAPPEPSAPTTPPPAASSAAPAPSAPFVAEKVWSEGKAMGTHIGFAAFTTPELDGPKVRAAFDKALAEIRRVEDLMTTWRPDAELSRVNAEAGKSAVKVSPETLALVQESIKTSKMSEGTFDITFETLHGLWKFDQDLDPHPPAAADVKARLGYVGYKNILVDESQSTIRLAKDKTKISLGGIAKGYAVDRATKVLDDAGIKSFYVQAGGDLFARGLKPDGSGWQAGVRDPRGTDKDWFALLSLSDHAFSTAGDYERAYVVGGKRYHHIIDPRTGYPATACRSVTIWAKTALQADAIDDAVFILGPQKGLALVESLDGVGAVIVDANNKIWISERLKPVLKLVRPPSDGI